MVFLMCLFYFGFFYLIYRAIISIIREIKKK